MSQIFITPLALFAAASLGTMTLFAGPAKAVESNDPIKVALLDWTSANISAKIIGGMLTRLGYTVEHPTVDTQAAMTTSLTNGDVTIIPEIWESSGGDAIKASDATGLTERLGALGPKAKEEWWYPIYMKEKCPGLPSWKALIEPECAKAFSVPETEPKGRYLGAPVSWGGYDEERVEALGLDFTVIHAGTDAAMFAELDSAYQRKAPIMLWFYSPHWAPTKYEGEWVEFPAYTDECYVDPNWGVNTEKLYDCGKPTGDILKYAWGGMKDKWPIAHKVAKAFQLDDQTLNKMVAEVDLEGKTIDDVAEAWVTENEASWRKWAE
jgi:glycine betaine/proline transport system substrate-binding protein